ncbi:MAG: hypothetical protein CL910_08925 [Deltaproteobacteria bacterium]|nr:hypothetical protein [Deltaproteobacteria bacterium]
MVLRLLGSLALVALLAAPASSLSIYHSPGDDGLGGGVFPLGPGTTTINLWADPTSAPGNGVFGIQDVPLGSVGGVSITTPFVCGRQPCLVDPTGRKFTAGDDINGDFAPFKLGSFDVDAVAAGSLNILSGTFLGADFNAGVIQLTTIASFVPEPSALALLGLGAIALRMGRRR